MLCCGCKVATKTGGPLPTGSTAAPSPAATHTNVQVSFQRQGAAGAQQVKARLMLVDLAGSERASLAAAGSATQREGSGINVGLLCELLQGGRLDVVCGGVLKQSS